MDVQGKLRRSCEVVGRWDLFQYVGTAAWTAERLDCLCDCCEEREHQTQRNQARGMMLEVKSAVSQPRTACWMRRESRRLLCLRKGGDRLHNGADPWHAVSIACWSI